MFSFLRIAKEVGHNEAGHGSTGDLNTNKLLAALFYGISSILVIFTNKAILTLFHFPYFKFVAAVQFATTAIILLTLSLMKRVDIPLISMQIVREILPISFMFLGNVICGLGSTKALNIPMFTALRRFSILMTMFGEWCFLNSKPSNEVVFSVFLMVGGALLAAVYDLSYDTQGYILVFLNNIFTALNGVWMKKASMSGKCSKMGVLFYNSLFSAVFMTLYFIGEHLYVANIESTSIATSDLVSGVLHKQHTFTIPQNLRANSPATVVIKATSAQIESSNAMSLIGIAMQSAFVGIGNLFSANYSHDHFERVVRVLSTISTTDSSGFVTTETPPTVVVMQSTLSQIAQYPGWGDASFLVMLAVACTMGSVLNYSIFLCTTLNSALTTAVVGTMKNVFTTYVGMIVFSDYSFTWVNFIGINISITGSLYYSYCTIFRRHLVKSPSTSVNPDTSMLSAVSTGPPLKG